MGYGIADNIGISAFLLPAVHGETLYDGIRAVADAGFAGLEIVPSIDQAHIGYPYNHRDLGIDLIESTPADIARLKSALSVFDWVTVHSPHLDWNLASANRHLRKLTWDYYDRCLEFAVELGARAMTYHMGGPTSGWRRDRNEILQFNCQYAEHIMPRARETGIPVGYEAGDLASLKYVSDRVEGWGINLDIGHAYMAAGSDEGFFAYIDEFAGRIAEVHHNGVNMYWAGYMEHQPPHMNNTIDFARTYLRLKEAGYQGPIICEITGHDIEQTIRHSIESRDLIVAIWNEAFHPRSRWGTPGA